MSLKFMEKLIQFYRKICWNACISETFNIVHYFYSFICYMRLYFNALFESKRNFLFKLKKIFFNQFIYAPVEKFKQEFWYFFLSLILEIKFSLFLRNPTDSLGWVLVLATRNGKILNVDRFRTLRSRMLL